jgi:hypothetical protein
MLSAHAAILAARSRLTRLPFREIMEVLEWTAGMDIGVQERAIAALAARKGHSRLVAIGPRAALFGGFGGSVSGSAGVKLREAFANLTRQIPAGRGISIAADVATARSLF